MMAVNRKGDQFLRLKRVRRRNGSRVVRRSNARTDLVAACLPRVP
jgi:hypothetical protein